MQHSPFPVRMVAISVWEIRRNCASNVLLPMVCIVTALPDAECPNLYTNLPQRQMSLLNNRHGNPNIASLVADGYIETILNKFVVGLWF